MMVTKRTIIRTIGSISSISLAGCGNNRSTPVKKLTIADIQVEEKEQGWEVYLEVENTYEAADHLAEFTEVTVIAYSADRLACSEDIGTVTAENRASNPVSVEMACSEFPTMITFDAAESPCDDDVRTVIYIATYDQEQGWCLGCHARECGEGLPPEPRE